MILNFPGALLAATFLFALGCSSNDEPTSPSPVDEPVAQSSPETAELAATSPKSESATVPEESATTTAKQWKDTAGNVLAVGQFVSLMDDKVCIETPEGLGTVVPLVNLCAADRKLVQAEPEADLTAEPEPEVAVEEMVEQIASTPPPADDHDQSQKVVIPFDFVSKFDDGRYGRNIGDMIVKKIQKQGTFAVPDAIDIRDLCAAQGVKITPETPLKEIQRVLRDLFDAQIAIWGSCERAPGQEWEIYDVTLKCADFSNNQQPKVLYEKSVRTKSVSEIPHLYVAEMLDKLYGREPGAPEPLDPVAEKNWIDNPNLVENGTFEAGARGVPTGWEDRGGQFREPLGKLVQWIPEAGNPEITSSASPSMPASVTDTASCTTAGPSPSKKPPSIVSNAASAPTAPRSRSSSSATTRCQAITNLPTWPNHPLIPRPRPVEPNTSQSLAISVNATAANRTSRAPQTNGTPTHKTSPPSTRNTHPSGDASCSTPTSVPVSSSSTTSSSSRSSPPPPVTARKNAATPRTAPSPSKKWKKTNAALAKTQHHNRTSNSGWHVPEPQAKGVVNCRSHTASGVTQQPEDPSVVRLERPHHHRLD